MTVVCRLRDGTDDTCGGPNGVPEGALKPAASIRRRAAFEGGRID